MCGRARCTLRADDVPRACHRTGAPNRSVDMDRYRPSYNVSPGWNMPVLRREDGADGGEGYAIHCMKWGLIPSFTKKNEKPDFYMMFNARSESVREKASFRRLIPKNRCLVAVEGFYEWKKDGSKKQPYYIHFKDGRPLVFAALYDSWQNSEGETLYTFSILTVSSSSALQWLHERMPVILGDKGAMDLWLYGSSTSKIDVVLKPYQDSDLVWHPVTPAMGKTSFDGPECIMEIKLKEKDKNAISKFFSRKEIKEEKESSPAESVGSDKSVEGVLPKSVKEELESNEKSGIISFTKMHEPTSEDPYEGETKGKTKRCYEELSTDYELKADESRKMQSSAARKEDNLSDHDKQLSSDAKLKQATDKSPARKKANLKSGGDKQPTLLSYFGKK